MPEWLAGDVQRQLEDLLDEERCDEYSAGYDEGFTARRAGEAGEE
jgi:hypothetical protein